MKKMKYVAPVSTAVDLEVEDMLLFMSNPNKGAQIEEDETIDNEGDQLNISWKSDIWDEEEDDW